MVGLYATSLIFLQNEVISRGLVVGIGELRRIKESLHHWWRFPTAHAVMINSGPPASITTTVHGHHLVLLCRQRMLLAVQSDLSTTFKVVVNTSQVLFHWILGLKPSRRTRSNVTRQTLQHLLVMAVLVHLPRRLSSASFVNVFYPFGSSPSSIYAIAPFLS